MVLIKNAIEEMVSCTNSRLTHTMPKDENRLEVRLWLGKSAMGKQTNVLANTYPNHDDSYYPIIIPLSS